MDNITGETSSFAVPTSSYWQTLILQINDGQSVWEESQILFVIFTAISPFRVFFFTLELAYV